MAWKETALEVLSALRKQHRILLLSLVASDEEEMGIRKLVKATPFLGSVSLLFCSTSQGMVAMIKQLDPDLHLDSSYLRTKELAASPTLSTSLVYLTNTSSGTNPSAVSLSPTAIRKTLGGPAISRPSMINLQDMGNAPAHSKLPPAFAASPIPIPTTKTTAGSQRDIASAHPGSPSLSPPSSPRPNHFPTSQDLVSLGDRVVVLSCLQSLPTLL
ncbi:hypothetical protein HDV03_004652 [Kappamyces sp. JEL0829]|nr:hypothetical protein HDV03_004652 [Kappamyces sp. JEL0829]